MRAANILFIGIFIASLIIPATLKFSAAEEPNFAPDFTLESIEGIEMSLSAYRGKSPVLIFFWASWCPYCLIALRSLNDMYPVLEREGIEVLAVNFRESRERVEKFAQRYALKYRVLLDRYGLVSGLCGIVGLPTYIAVNKQGCLVFHDNYLPKQEIKSIVARDCD